MIPVKVIVVVVAVATAVLSTAFAVASQSFIDFFATAQDAKLVKNTVGGHTAGYGLYETSGDVLDPANSYNTASEKVVIDPDKYLRSFNYGRISKLADGSTVREFTLVADDRQTMEISPGVFYNIWSFNGTIPGPTLRATEGDLIRINFIKMAQSLIRYIHTASTRPRWMGYLKLLILKANSLMSFMLKLLEYIHITAMSPPLRNIFLMAYMAHTSSIPRLLGPTLTKWS